MCRLYFARKKLTYVMSLDIDRPITRAVVVGCAISATRNYLKLHMSQTLKILLCNTHAVTRKLWCVLPGCRLSNGQAREKRHRFRFASVNIRSHLVNQLRCDMDQEDVRAALKRARRRTTRGR